MLSVSKPQSIHTFLPEQAHSMSGPSRPARHSGISKRYPADEIKELPDRPNHSIIFKKSL
jgi:hypothetical protein